MSRSMIDEPAGILTPETSQTRSHDSVTLLTFFLLFLFAIPSRLVFAPLGGAGSPSTIVGIVFFVWYLLNWLHPSSTIARGRQPIRRAAVLFFCAIFASYASATQHALNVTERNGVDRGLVLIIAWLGILLLAADGIDSIDRL